MRPSDSSNKKLIPTKLRPTIIVGLGGTGYRITLEVKARLEEQFGSNSEYNNVVKYLALDTANENFTTRQPNNPDKIVSLSPDREFVRISDVPLHDLMQSRDTNPAIDAIFPEILQSTQIDQGAQQVRRLGRIALFYHYRRIREKLKSIIEEIHNVSVMGRLGTSEDESKELFVTDRKRLRVFVVCSICGGTGSGTFIDMAYFIRKIAGEAGFSERAVDVVGVLLLPEVFPQISTTGMARIRANAYAALLDLEYYNQSAAINQQFYSVDMPGGEKIRVSGGPFSSCYLVGSSSTEGTVGSLTNLSPILADAISTMIATRLGEQTDATLDNVRASLTTYFKGYRAFYSAMGVSQIVYPRLWIRQEFGRQLKQRIINEVFLAGNQDLDPANAVALNRTKAVNVVEKWFDSLDTDLRAEHFTMQNDELEGAVTRLENIREEAGLADNPVADLRRAFNESMQNFRRNIRQPVEEGIIHANRTVQQKLNRAVRRNIDLALKTASQEDGELGGFQWTLDWLTVLDTQVREHLENLRSNDLIFNENAILKAQLTLIENNRSNPMRNVPILGKSMTQSVRESADALRKAITDDAYEMEVSKALISIYSNMLLQIERKRQDVRQVIAMWMKEWRDQVRTTRPPTYPDTTQSVLSDEELVEKVREDVQRIMAQNRGVLLGEILSECGDLSFLLDFDEHEKYLRTFTQFAENKANDSIAIETERITSVDDNDRDNDASDDEQGFDDEVDGDNEGRTRRRGRTNTEKRRNSVASHLYLDDDSSPKSSPHISRRNEMLSKLYSQAQPLLVYNEGMLSGMPPRVIKVVGAETREQAKVIQRELTDERDASEVETNDPSTVTLLVTEHGVPAVALSKFDDYRVYYEQLRAKRDAIFHLDNERETRPHDPGSRYFVNFQDVEMYFARALAYGWIKRLGNDNEQAAEGVPKALFAMNNDFYRYLAKAINEEQGRLVTRKSRYQQEAEEKRYLAGWTQFDDDLLADRKRILDDMHEGLEQRKNAIVEASTITGFRYKMAETSGKDYYVITMQSTPSQSSVNNADEQSNTIVYPTELDLALLAIYRDPLRSLPALFIRAFDAYEEEFTKGKDKSFTPDEQKLKQGELEDMITTFLTRRGYDTTGRKTNRRQDRVYYLSTFGAPSRDLENRIIDLLVAQNRLEQRLKYNERLDTTYFDPDLSDDLDDFGV